MKRILFVSHVCALWQGRHRLLRALRVSLGILFDCWRLAKQTHSGAIPTDEIEALKHKVHTKNAQRLFLLLQSNGGTWIKLGQFLSARPDFLPLEYIEALQPLQNNVEPLPFQYIEPVLNRNWGKHWRERFSRFDEVPVASASIAQVYRASLPDGTQVAIKIRNPDIHALYEQDLVLYRVLARALAVLLPKLDVVGTVGVFLDSLQQELDFLQEARNVTIFNQLPHLPGVRSLSLRPELCSADIVATEWVEGVTLLEYLRHASAETRYELLSLLQHSYIQQVIRFGTFQGDAHPGNYLIDNDGNLVFVDFGYLGSLSDRERLSYVNLILAVMDGDARSLRMALRDGGFTCLLDEVFPSRLMDLIHTCTRKEGQNIQFQQVEKMVREVLDTIRQRRANVPAHYLVTGRVFVTLTGLFKLFEVIPESIDTRAILLGVQPATNAK